MFNAETNSYTAEVGESVTSIEVTAEKEYEHAELTITPPAEFKRGANMWKIEVVSQDGINKEVYYVTIAKTA